jgi:hypothetical protein
MNELSVQFWHGSTFIFGFKTPIYPSYHVGDKVNIEVKATGREKVRLTGQYAPSRNTYRVVEVVHDVERRISPHEEDETKLDVLDYTVVNVYLAIP